jgi:uncharacterized protein YjlB
MTENFEPTAIRFADDGAIPNHPRFPVLIYRAAFPVTADTAAGIERLFARNHWPPEWRNGIYDFHHYHSTAHEALGIARGSARVRLGGEQGQDFDLAPGDAVILPAGTGHKRLAASPDLLVIGAYPPGQHWDLLRGRPSERPAALDNIARVPVPSSDPVRGHDGPLIALWPRSQ